MPGSKAQVISPVMGKTFITPVATAHGTFLVNLHRSHRELMQQLADENKLTVEFREDAVNGIGQPNPKVYAVHILTPGYDYDHLRVELNKRILDAWAEKQIQLQIANAQ